MDSILLKFGTTYNKLKERYLFLFLLIFTLIVLSSCYPTNNFAPRELTIDSYELRDDRNGNRVIMHKGDVLITLYYKPSMGARVEFQGVQARMETEHYLNYFGIPTGKNASGSGKEAIDDLRENQKEKSRKQIFASLGEVAPGLIVLIVLGSIFGGGGVIWIIIKIKS